MVQQGQRWIVDVLGLWRLVLEYRQMEHPDWQGGVG
jgi:hypothetical protein